MNHTDENEKMVIDLRRQGRTFEEIANTVGLANKSVAYNIYKRMMEREYAMTQEMVEEHRRAELHKLEEMYDKLAVAMDYDDAGLKVIDRLIKIMDRKAKLLGLDAPTRVESSVNLSLTHEEALLELDGATVIDAIVNPDYVYLEDNDSDNTGEE